MQAIYSTTAAARFLDREAAVAALRERAAALVRADANVDSVALFGSLARGEATSRSDADVLLLLSESHGIWVDRIPRYSHFFEGLGLDVDVFPLTRDEWACRLEEGDLFCHRIAETYLCLAGKAPAGEGGPAGGAATELSRAGPVAPDYA